MMSFIFCFLFCYFEPSCLLSKTIITGGDTGSHYYTAKYLRDYLLPHGRISGWCQGNLAGYPMLQYYFPLPFLIMAVLSWLIPLEIAFKLVSVLGTFLLPPCTYLFFRLLRQPFPVPIMGALFSLSFLFMEGNSMWGGNIPSTLSGQFCHSLGFSLSILWLGLVYRAVKGKKGLSLCSVLLALTGLCHGYTLLFALFASTFFLFTTSNFLRNIQILLRIHVPAFFLLAFWLLPLMVVLPNTTRFSIAWIFFDWDQVLREVFPSILYPFIALTFINTAWVLIKKKRSSEAALINPMAFIWFIILCSAGLYGMGYRMKVVDVRFLPFFQFFLVIGGALIFAALSSRKMRAALTGLLSLFLVFLWVDAHETFISDWIRTNYEGFEEKEMWAPFSATNEFLTGSMNDPRVYYEYSMLYDRVGTVRAFELLPLFSGRSTLEGLQLPASLCVPFIFYLQSEISLKASTPLPDYNYSRFNLKRGVEHLKLFNVRDLVVVEDATREAVKDLPEFSLRYRDGPFRVYELTTNPNRYVEPVRYKPVLTTTWEWRRLSYHWFRRGDLSVPIVFKDKFGDKDLQRFHVMNEPDISRLPREPLETFVPLKETVSEDEILIQGAPKGRPLLIKIAYHPNWKVEGADRIYLASPAFMLVYPDSSRVRLYYGRTWPDHVGAAMTALGILFVCLSGLSIFRRPAVASISLRFGRYCGKTAFFCIPLAILAVAYYLVKLSPEFPSHSYHKGVESYTRGDYDAAKRYFERVLVHHPQSLTVDFAGYLHAMCSYKQKDWDGTIRSLNLLLDQYPETTKASEALYYLGFCHQNSGNIREAREYYERIIREFPGEIWARYADDRLREIRNP